MDLDWTAILVAIVSLGGTIVTTLKVRKQAQKPDIVGQAGQVSSLAVAQMQRMAEEMERLEAEVEDLRVHVRLLEGEVIRLGGDPVLVLSRSR